MFPPLTIIAVRTIERGGVTYQPGDELRDVPYAEGASLIAQGFAVPPGAELAPVRARSWATSWRDR